MKRVLIIAPHCDDEILGAGSTLARHIKEGDEVYSCIVTRAYTPDWTEQQIISREYFGYQRSISVRIAYG